MDLVGRDDQCALLRGLLDQAVRGVGLAVVLTGEPGVGKTALLDDLIAHARTRGVLILTGRAVASAGPYRPFAEALMPAVRDRREESAEELMPYRSALGRVLPGWAVSSPPEPGVDPTLVLGEGLLRLLTRLGPAGCLMALEDLHDADTESLALADYLASAIPAFAVLLVVTTRDLSLDGLAQLASRSATVEVPLGRLAPAEVAELVQRVRRLPDHVAAEVVQRAEGLPLAATDLAASVDEGDGAVLLPTSFTALVDGRLAALNAAERRVLQTAALLDTAPDADLVPIVADVDEDVAVAALEHAVRLHLLTADRGRLRWRHGLIREALAASLLPLERRALARRAAAAWPATNQAALANLLFEAGDPGAAADLWLRLARMDLAGGALRSARDRLDRAASTGLAAAEVALVRVELLTLQGRPDQALRLGGPVLDQARGDDHADLCLQLARAAVAAGRWSEAEELVRRAGRPADPQGAIILADAAHGASRIEDAARLATEAVGRARAADRPELLAEALCVSGRLNRLRDLGSAMAAFAEAEQVAGEHGLRPHRLTALIGLGTLELNEYEDSPSLREARRIALELGLIGQASAVEMLLAEHQMLAEGTERLDAPATALAERGRQLGVPALSFAAASLRATRAAVAGEPAAMEAQLGVIAGLPQLPPDHAAQIPATRGLAALCRHDLAGAEAHLTEAVRGLLGQSSSAPLSHVGLWAVVAAAGSGGDEDTWSALRAHPAVLRRVNRGSVLVADAITAGRSGDATVAAEHLAAGDALLEPLPWWRRLLHLVVLEAAIADGWGDPVPRLRADLAVYEQGGEVALTRLCRELLRRAGAPTRRGRGDSVVPPRLRAYGITSRELDVLRLVQEGLGNTAISARLFLSRRTVETHVANLLAKSGTANRRELCEWWRTLTP